MFNQSLLSFRRRPESFYFKQQDPGLRRGDALGYCAQLVKDHDPDRFLMTMAMPTHMHEGLLALFAFNHEVAKIRETVSETQLGLIRLQWWHEALEEIYEGVDPRQHKVVEALARAIHAYDLPQEPFKNLLYAREFDLEDVLPANMEGFLNYIDFTSSPLLMLAAQITGQTGDTIQPIAMNYALVGLLRAVPYHARQQRCYLPADLMQKYDQKVEKLYNFQPSESFSELIEDIAAKFINNLKPDNRFLKYINRLSFIYLKQIQALNHNVFDPKLNRPPYFKEIRLFLL